MKIEKQKALLFALGKGWLSVEPATGHCYSHRDVGSMFRLGKRMGKSLRNGYRRGAIWVKGICHQFYLHQLVWLAARGPIPSGLQVNHINAIKTDNRVENLELVDGRQNTQHAARLGLLPGNVRPHPKGSEHPNSKLTEGDIPKIRELIKQGLSQKEVAGRFGVSRRTIQFILTGVKWRHVGVSE